MTTHQRTAPTDSESLADPLAPVRCLLLDLDGTLVDTAPDLAHSLNVLRAEQGLEAMDPAAIRPHVSHGARALVRLGFDIAEDDPGFAGLRARFLEIYRLNLSRESRPFPGIEELLSAIEARDLQWGVVTNKPEWLTLPIMADLGLARRAACIVSGDSTPRNKPHPDPLFHAGRLTGRMPQECLFVGDAERDIQAGRSAGMKTLVALFGYIPPTERPQEWQADGLVSHPMEILDWL